MARPLTSLALFRDLEPQQIKQLLARAGHTTRSYGRGDVIALKGARYGALMILADGRIVAETLDRSENVIKREKIEAPALVMPTHLFAADNKLPVNISARGSALVISIDRDDFCSMMREDERVMRNFLEIISTPSSFIAESVVYLTYKTIKGKFANYLLDLIERTEGSELRNPLTQREMAEMFGVTRPALARAIGELVEEGTIFVKGKQINVLFVEKLRHYAKY